MRTLYIVVLLVISLLFSACSGCPEYGVTKQWHDDNPFETGYYSAAGMLRDSEMLMGESYSYKEDNSPLSGFFQRTCKVACAGHGGLGGLIGRGGKDNDKWSSQCKEGCSDALDKKERAVACINKRSKNK